MWLENVWSDPRQRVVVTVDMGFCEGLTFDMGFCDGLPFDMGFCDGLTFDIGSCDDPSEILVVHERLFLNTV